MFKTCELCPFHLDVCRTSPYRLSGASTEGGPSIPPPYTVDTQVGYRGGNIKVVCDNFTRLIEDFRRAKRRAERAQRHGAPRPAGGGARFINTTKVLTEAQRRPGGSDAVEFRSWGVFVSV